MKSNGRKEGLYWAYSSRKTQSVMEGKAWRQELEISLSHCIGGQEAESSEFLYPYSFLPFGTQVHEKVWHVSSGSSLFSLISITPHRLAERVISSGTLEPVKTISTITVISDQQWHVVG